MSDWDAEALEALVISNELVEALWLVPRQSAPVQLSKKHGELLIGLEIFLDRWILAIYADGFINIWDIHETNTRWGCVHTGNDKTTSYQAALDDSEEKLLIVITKTHR